MIWTHQNTEHFFTSPLSTLNELGPREGVDISGSCFFIFEWQGFNLYLCMQQQAPAMIFRTMSILNAVLPEGLKIMAIQYWF